MRNVHAAAISMERQPTVEASLATAMIHMEQAALFKPDIAFCLKPASTRVTFLSAPRNITNDSRKTRDIGCYIASP